MSDNYEELKNMYMLVQKALYASYIKKDDKEVENIVKQMDDLIYENYDKQRRKAAAKFANELWTKNYNKIFKDKND